MIKLTTRTIRPALLSVVCAIALVGCSSMAPDYERSELPIASDWAQQQSNTLEETPGLTSQKAAELPWRQFIHEPRLTQVIELALSSNRSLRETLADVESARATYRIQKADLYPQLSAGLSGTRAKSSDGDISTLYQAEAGLSGYEIDLFGKNRSLSEADMQSYLASAETAKAAQIALIGEVANAWLTLASDSSLLSLAKETAGNAQKTMDITKKRLELGVDSKIDLASAQTVYHTARSDIASFNTQVEQDINALRLLVGQQLDTTLLPSALPDGAELVSDIPAGLSSDVLLQRPDVLSAEHDLKSANADIGAARAAFFPSLSLTATGGLASSVLADIFSGGASSIWTLAPSLNIPIFTGGANDAQLAFTQAQKQKFLAAYEYAIQSAFSEVADALARKATIQEQLAAQEALVAAATRSYDLSLARYKGGVDSFQNALEAQRTMYNASQTLVSTRQTDLINRVTLYRVLGGGLADAANENLAVAVTPGEG